MKKKFASLILSFAMVISCLFALTACGGKKKGGDATQPPVEDTNPVSSISVELVSTDFVMTNGTITFDYGTKVELDVEDFKVTANMKDQTTKELPLKTDTVDGYTFASTVPIGDPTAAGNFKLTFTYSERQAEVNVKVNKGVVDMTGVEWESTNEFTYNKSEHSVRIDESTLPEGVTVSYENNAKTNAGEYTAVANFTYEDAANYEAIESMTFDWKINKATHDMSNVSLMSGYAYSGSPITTSILFLPTNVQATVVSGSLTQTEIGSYDVEFSFVYTGEDDANYEAISNRVLTFEIVKGNVYSQVYKVFKWTGEEQTLLASDVNLPEGVEITEFVSGNVQTNIGQHMAVAKISFTEEAKEIYKEVETINVFWSITKATYSFTNVVWSRDDVSAPLYYSGEEYSVELLNLPQGVTATYSNNVGKNAGTYVTTATFTYDTEHYHAPYISPLTWVINPKSLIVKANDVSVAYGTPAKNYLTVTYDGFVENENKENALTGEIEFLISNYNQNSPVGEYEVTPYNLKANYGNYTIDYQKGKLTVTKLTIDVSAVKWDYDPAKPYSYKGSQYAPKLKNIPLGVNVTYTYMLGTETVAYPKNVGEYKANATFGATNSNYEIINNTEVPTLNWEIKAVELKVTVEKTITYGETLSGEFDVIYTGFVGSDDEGDVSGIVILGDIIDYVDGSANVGEYVVEIDAESDISAENYIIVYENGTLIVEKAKIVLSDLVWNYTSPYVYSGAARTPQISNIPVNVNATYTYKNANDETESYPTNVGVYTATVEIVGTENYEVEGTVEGISFEILKKDVTITFNNQSIEYYTEPSQTDYEVEGLVLEETVDEFDTFVVTFGEWEISANAGSTFEISATCEDDNYNVIVVPATLSIEVAMVSLDGIGFENVSTYTYNKEEQYPKFDAAKKLPSYVEYAYLINGSESVQPINAGSYTVSIQFAETNNYLIDGSVDAKSFEIQKATIDESKIYWVANVTVGDDSIYTNERLEEEFFEFLFEDGLVCSLELVNETGCEITFETVEGSCENGSEFSEVGDYQYRIKLSLSSEMLKNYEDLTVKEYTVVLSILENMD